MKYFEQRKARIEIIPMIDIMLFLLVFFIIVTLHMIPATGVATHLPASSTAQTMQHPDIVVTLQADGSIMMDNRPLSLDDLGARLRQHNPAKTSVTIAGASKAPLQALLSVMDACREAGITRLGIAAKPTDKAVNGA